MPSIHQHRHHHHVSRDKENFSVFHPQEEKEYTGHTSLSMSSDAEVKCKTRRKVARYKKFSLNFSHCLAHFQSKHLFRKWLIYTYESFISVNSNPCSNSSQLYFFSTIESRYKFSDNWD